MGNADQDAAQPSVARRPLAALSPYPETDSLEKMSWAQARWTNAK
jgi:hypothetical protein